MAAALTLANAASAAEVACMGPAEYFLNIPFYYSEKLDWVCPREFEGSPTPFEESSLMLSMFMAELFVFSVFAAF